MVVILWTILVIMSSMSIQVQQYQRTFHVIWIIAFVAALIPIATNYQTNTGGWCYIDGSRSGGVWMQFFCDYFWCILTWVFSVVLYFKMFRSHQSLDESSIIAQVKFYPMVFFVCWLFAVIRRTVSAVGINPPLSLICIQIVCTNLYGLCNAVVWGLTIYNHIYKMKNPPQPRQFPPVDVHGVPTKQSSSELPNKKLINEQDLNYDERDGNGHLVEIDLSGDGDDGLVEVQEASD